MTRPRVLPSLRLLAQPLAALGVVLVLWATVIPVVSRADGTWCIGTLGGLSPTAWAKPICDHCVPVVLADIAVPALPFADPVSIPHDTASAKAPVFAAVALQRIRGPPLS